MLIKSIEMNNFFRIYGKVKIDFSLDPEKNVTVICGENGMGKTTMLSAFYWALYGDVVSPLVVKDMLNKRALQEMEIGETRESNVTVELKDDKSVISFSRTQLFKKTNNEAVTVGEPEISIFDITNAKSIDDKNYFENIIPYELRGFFFFDGERIDRLSKIDGKVEIKKAILDILGLTTLDDISTDLDAVKSAFNKDMKAAAFGTDVAFLNDEYEKYTKLIEEANKKIEEAKGKWAANKKVVSECDDFLREHDAKAVKELTEKRNSCESKIREMENLIASCQRIINANISDNAATYILSNHFKELDDFLEEKRKKKELPSDIKETFVNDLLQSGTCICGRSFVVGDPAYDALIRIKETAGHEELDNAYIRIKSYISSSSTQENTEKFIDNINKEQKKIFDADMTIKEANNELKDIALKLANSDDEMVAAKEKLRETASNQMTEASNIIAIYTDKRDGKGGYVEKQEEISKKIAKAESKNKEAKMYSKCFAMSGDILELNGKIRKTFVEITRSEMDEKLKEVFAILARKKDREPVLNENFELKIVNKDSQSEQILSTGERQVTSLSFIGALVAYAKEKPQKGILSDFAGGDFPIVMDSPFGNLDSSHKTNVCQGIPNLASQVVIIVSGSQWNGDVKDNIMPKVNKIYKMTDGVSELKDAEFTVITEVN